MFLNRIQVDRDRISLLRSLKEKASLVLVSKHYSRLDYWVFSRRLLKEGIGPVADLRSLIREEFSLTEGVLKVHGSGQIPYMALYDPGLFKRGYLKGGPHPLETTIASLTLSEKPVYLVPLTILYRNSLNKLRPSFWDILLGYGENPGVIRKALIFLRFSRDCVLSIGEPILISPGDGASTIRERILSAIDLEKRVCLGPLFKGKQEIKEEVLTDKRVLEVIEGFSKGDPQAEKKARKEAEKYFEEIASDYSPFFAQLFVVFLNWLWPRIFEGIEISQEELMVVKEAARKATLVYVPSHRSHVDYLVLNHMLYLNMLHSPRIAAGVNLLFWPMGTLFRKAGAFFIRRAFRGAKLYTAVFTSYLKMLIKEGYPIEFFIEGGRSRTGKLANPKAGLLTLILSTYLEERGRNIAFVPVSIVYDKVPEDEEYAQELMGKEKEKESTLQLIRAVRFLKKRYGKVYIRFGKPIYADESLKSETIDLAHQAQELADQIAISINRITVVTPLSLVSAAVLSKFRGGFTEEQLKEALNNYVSYLSYAGSNLSNTLRDVQRAVDHTLALLGQWNIIKDIGDQTRSYWGIREEKRIILDYYKNSLLYHLLPCSLVCLSLTSRGHFSEEVILQDIRFLKFLLKHEFVFSQHSEEKEQIAHTIQFLVNNQLATFDRSSGFNLTQKGKEYIIMFTAPILSILQVYWLASKEAIRLKEEEGRISRILPKNISKLAGIYRKLGMIKYPEAINQVGITNASNLFNTEVKSQENLKVYLGENADIYTLNRHIESFLMSGGGYSP